MNYLRPQILCDIVNERARQQQLAVAGKFAFTCADAGMSNPERFLVLAEEVGEVGHELNEAIGPGRKLALDKLRTELVQVAAVAVAWVEAIDSGRAS